MRWLQLGYWWDTPDLVLAEVSEASTIETLLLVGCPKLTDVSIERILAGCKNLKKLVLHDNMLITFEAIRAYLRSGRKIRLEVTECVGVARGSLLEDLRTEEVLQCLKP